MTPPKLGVIGVNGLRLLLRDRMALFFVFVFPLALVLVLGSVFGGSFEVPLGVVAPRGDRLATEIVDRLAATDDVEVERYDTADALRSAVERGEAEAAVFIPGDYARRLRDGDPAQIRFLARPTGISASLRPVVQDAVSRQSARLQAARFAAEQGSGGSGSGPDFDTALEEAAARERSLPRITVRTTTVGEQLFPESLGRYDLGASSQLVLFMFVTGLAGAGMLVQSRQLGVMHRMLSTPTSMATILGGEAMARFLIVVFQGVYIMAVSWLAFGVDWGDPVGAAALLVAFALPATGAALLAGAVFENDEQASSIGVFAGLGVAALGGSMAPLEVFSPLMRDIAHLTPHAWANDGFAELVRRHGSVLDIVPELAVLVAMGAALIALATWILRRSLTS